jgi:crossover junction endodeoxyribonuclease RuvC
MMVLGIDPGIARCGYGVVRSEGQKMELVTYGCMETPAGLPLSKRLSLLHQQLTEVLKQYRPQRVGVEKLFFSKNVKSAMQVGEARGVVMFTLDSAGLLPIEMTPNEVKLAVCGQGSADKKQVQTMIKMLLRLPSVPQPDDAADAVAIALAAATWKTFA